MSTCTPLIRSARVALLLALTLLCAHPAPAQQTVTNSGSIWINELRFRRTGHRARVQAVEIAAQPGQDISSHVLIVYYTYRARFGRPWGPRGGHLRRSGHLRRGEPLRRGRASVRLARQTYSGTDISFRVYRFHLPHGLVGPVGVALHDGTTVVEFLSVGGVVSGRGRTAGFVSTDIGIDVPRSAARGFSLQLIGSGSVASDFSWAAPKANTFGQVNHGQMVAGPVVPPPPPGPKATEPRINEFHYDNVGTDVGEMIEIVSDVDDDLTGYTVALYNGNGGVVYNTLQIDDATETVVDSVRYSVLNLPTNGLQNDVDGIALVDATQSVIDFVCYEGTLTATSGPASGQTCTDVGAGETDSTPIGQSVQRIGCGTDTTWVVQTGTAGAANTCQSFEPCTAPQTTTTRINEIHYDNADTDVGERIEIVANAGTDLTGWTVLLYNGANGAVYNTQTLSGAVTDSGNGVGFSVVTYPTNGIQNGPDGVALVDGSGTLVEFLCYEGTFAGAVGAASGQTCTDIEVTEGFSTQAGTSMQRSGCGSAAAWVKGTTETFGSVNEGQRFEY